jgi:hypothetical protein
MDPFLDENGIEPPFLLGVLEEVVTNPVHQLLPGLRTTFAMMTLFAIAQESWTATIQFLSHLGG